MSLPRLHGVIPSRIDGSWKPQKLLIHGESLPVDVQLVASWGQREKLLSPEKVEWLDSNTLRVTVTTGVRAESWQLQMLLPDGQRSTPVKFQVLASGR